MTAIAGLKNVGLTRRPGGRRGRRVGAGAGGSGGGRRPPARGRRRVGRRVLGERPIAAASSHGEKEEWNRLFK